MSLKYTTGPITKADAGGIEAIITTPRVDSDGESIDPLGITNRDQWLTNPLVYWAHEWAMNPTAEPIGKGTSLEVTREAIGGAAVFAPTPKAQNVRALVIGGFVRKTSVGFDPIEVRLVGGIPTHTKWALREWSIVPMPANTDATIIGVKSALRWFADQLADPEETPVGLAGGLDPTALLATVNDANLTMFNDGRTVVISDEAGRRIARIRPRRLARLP